MATNPRTIELRALRLGKLGLDNLVKEMIEGREVLAPHIRRAVDNVGEAKNVLHLDGQLKKRYEAFKKVVEATDKNEKINFEGLEGKGAGTYSRAAADKIVNTVEGRGGASDRYKYKDMGDKKNALMGKLFIDMQGITEMGHRDLSILVGSMSLLLVEMDPKDPRRAALRGMLVIAKEIDKLTKGAEMSLTEFANIHKDQLKSPLNVYADAKVAVDALKGVKGTVDYTMELRDINNKKSQLSVALGKEYNKLVAGDTKSFEKILKGIDITNLSGSPTIAQHIGAQIRDILDPKARYKKGTVKPKRGKGRVAEIGKAKTKKLKSGRLAPIKLTKPKKVKAKTSKVSMNNMLGMINAKLPGVVLDNMGAPGLESRTGKFAQSVKVTEVIQTRGGFPSIGYSYQKDPYQVFESTSGTRFADPDRDPRRIIDTSIRELAAQMAIGRLYTRRV